MIKKLLKSLPFFFFLKQAYGKFKGIVRHPLQNSKTIDGYNIVYLGTDYGGWNFVDEGYLKNSTIISAGLGEDASFDVEFAAKYNARVIIVDPTPRAIKHFNEIQASIGNTRSQSYSDGGCQPIKAYDLSKVKEDNFKFIKKALWNECKNIKFFEPSDPKNISHSISNFQNNYSNDTGFIEVEAITPDRLFDELNLDFGDVSLVKFDIEGAEIEVIKRCVSVGFLPFQILVEFDELTKPSPRAFARVSEIDELLKNNDYKMIKTDGRTNFLFVRY